MQKVNDKRVYRVIDANFNRAKEGLRVCEDTCRFVLDEKKLTKQYKTARHELTSIIASLGPNGLVVSRDVSKDVGTRSNRTELKRKNIQDIYNANSQRIKESIRVLEEFTKLFNKHSAKNLKKIRYKMYALEKETTSKL